MVGLIGVPGWNYPRSRRMQPKHSFVTIASGWGVDRNNTVPPLKGLYFGSLSQKIAGDLLGKGDCIIFSIGYFLKTLGATVDGRNPAPVDIVNIP